MSNFPEQRLPSEIFAKAVSNGTEYGWRLNDFLEVLDAAKQVPMACLGGQVQYILPDGTCELYWLNYDSEKRRTREDWSDYCDRTAGECRRLFLALTSSINIEKEAVNSFPFLLAKQAVGLAIDEYKTFMLYFDDSESHRYQE